MGPIPSHCTDNMFYYLNNIKWCILIHFIMENMPSESKIHPPPR